MTSTSAAGGYAEVIGDPIEQSLSPLIHNFWLEAAGIAGEYRRRQVGTGVVPRHEGFLVLVP